MTEHARILPLAFVLAMSGAASGAVDLRPGDPSVLLRSGSLRALMPAGDAGARPAEPGVTVVAQTCYAGAWRRC